MQSVKKNEHYTLDITGMTHEGQGVGRIEGLAVFVDGALEDEQVEVRVIKLNKSYAVGKLVEILKPSPKRVKPFCGAYSRCGGCNLQHIDYHAQLDFKTRLVKDNLERIGGLKEITVHDTIGMLYPRNYRNKAQYPVASVNGSIVTGFYAARSHDVIESEKCGIQDIASEKVLRIVSRFIREKGISAYDEMTGNGLVRHIVTRVGFHTGEVMAVLVINGKALPGADELVRRLIDGVGALPETVSKPEDTSETTAGGILKWEDTGYGTEAAADSNLEPEDAGVVAQTAESITKSEGSSKDAEGIIKSEGSSGAAADSNLKDAGNSAIKSIYLNVNTANTNVIMGPKNILLYGSETITDTIGNYRFFISPQSFFQVNPVQTEVLYSKAMEYAALSGEETVFDLYCGIGTISLFLSEKARHVYGVEVVEDAVADARRNAELNGVANVEFITGEAEKVVTELYNRGIRADVVVLDPPRKGCEESLLKLLSEMQPKRIVYVSCNPATLARDLKYLAGNGFKAVEAQPVDMFPWTGHVESIVLMTKCGFEDKNDN